MTSHLPPKTVPQQSLPTLCVALAGTSVPEMLAHSATLADEFPFQELRLDTLPHPLAAVSELQAHVRLRPGIVFLATCRRVPSGGRFLGSAEAEFAVLLAAASAGFKLVDLSIESAEQLGPRVVHQLREAGAAVLLSWHDFEATGDLPAVLERMRPFAPDLCKIVPFALSLPDSLSLLRLLARCRAEADMRVVALSMGEAGVLTRILGVRAGSAFTFAAASADDATAPGQIAARTLRHLYRMEEIRPETPIYGVAGDPIRSSLSPLMLNTAFQASSIQAVYVPLLTADAAELFTAARELPLAGFSVTMPLKQAVMPLLQHIDPLATRIGAVNTVRRRPDGSFEGFNTDAAGIVSPLERRVSLASARVLVLGAGGAARAAVFGCLDRGAAVTILNRSPEAAARLAFESGATIVTRHTLPSLPPFDVLINATPAGMRGNANNLPLQPEELHARLVFDLVYNPLKTPLLAAARNRGLATISGVEMFVHQGARQFELWTGRPAPVDAMRQVVMQALSGREERQG